jgi:hypothetical protein
MQMIKLAIESQECNPVLALQMINVVIENVEGAVQASSDVRVGLVVY